jgi:DTW domain-containing protein YfiP
METKRLVCARCLRPQCTCICQWITPVAHATEVLILQHPLEVGHAKGSAHLLHLNLPNSRVVVGEAFDEQLLHQLLYAPFVDNAAKQTIQPVLLYPTDDAMAAAANASDDASSVTRLVVLDGTWRKSSKMLYLNPLLQLLPRMPLHNPPASRYTIRKAHEADQLSTYEATCHALMQLEAHPGTLQPLLDAFDGFVAQQHSYTDPHHHR